MVSPGSARRRRVALLDWDNSLREGFSLTPWLEWLAETPADRDGAQELRDLVESWDAEPPRIELRTMAARAAEICLDFFEGRSVTRVVRQTETFIKTDRLRPGADGLITGLIAAGVAPVIISGAPQEVLLLHAERLGIDAADVHGLIMANDGSTYGRALQTGNMALSKSDRVAIYARTSDIVIGLGDDHDADGPLVDPAAIKVWVDRNADDEDHRLSWSGMLQAASGSFDDFSKLISARLSC